jgi:hypothetical protein
VTGTTLLFLTNTPNPLARNYANEDVELMLTGPVMPSSCDSMNSWVYVVKAYASSASVHEYIVKNPFGDTCHGKHAILFGDPHFTSFSGGNYDINGRVNFFYNIITDANFHWNAKFVSRNPRGHGSMHTYIGESAFLIHGTRIFCDPVKWAMFVDGRRVPMSDERQYLHGGVHYVKFTETIMYIRAPGFFIALKHVLKDHGKELAHFDHVVDLTDEPNGRVRPHGLLGQTATFTKPVVAKGKQGEGVIAGVVADYEVSTLWSLDCKYSRYGSYK